MRILFSVDGIKNMDLLYTWTIEHSEEFGDGRVEHYHGNEYCKAVATNVFRSLAPSDWADHRYLGSLGRIANETFVFRSIEDYEYNISFAIKTYSCEAARIEITIVSPKTDSYDQKLESLKITLKDKLIPDWQECTWLMDEQAASLCKEAYEKAFTVENNLRAFASKILIHFLGVNWIKRTGLEKEAESVNNLKEKFIQRVSEFDNINTDFLSMTLETLTGIIFKGVIYNDDVVLSHQDYIKIQQMGARQNATGSSVADYIKSRRIEYKKIWNDLFIPYIDDPDAFKDAIHAFTEDRNHVAHSKVLSKNAYQVIMNDFDTMNSLILSADTKFESEETADEVYKTWVAEHEENEKDEMELNHYRYLIASDTGMDILDENKIKEWFDKVLYKIFNDVYQQYHLDVCYEISVFSTPDEDKAVFSISCPAVDNNGARIDIIAKYYIDDGLGEDSICEIIAKNGAKDEICKTKIRYHNGDGCEGEEGFMEAIDNSEYDTSELEDFKEELFEAIEFLNPLPAELNALAYESKGAVQFISDFPCEQCGKLGVSINDSFLPIGRCCYCGYENKLVKCERCGELINADAIDHGLCPSCVFYIEKQ